MPLPALNWRLAATTTVGTAGNINSILDAIWTAGGSCIYWTWGRDTTNAIQSGATTAAYAQPVSPTALNQRIIWAGTTATSGLAWQQFVGAGIADSRSGSQIYCGCAKNGGAYSNWNSGGTPFTTGQFTGFSYAGSLVTVDRVTLLESQEAVAVVLWRSAGAQVSPSIAGAWIEPLTSSTQVAESDGRLYGISTLGTGTLNGSWLGTTGASTWISDTNASTQSRCGVFLPGAATINVLVRSAMYSLNVAFLDRAGRLVLVPIQVQQVTGSGVVSFTGRMRQIFMIRDARNNLVWDDGGVTKGHILGSSSTLDNDALVFTT